MTNNSHSSAGSAGQVLRVIFPSVADAETAAQTAAVKLCYLAKLRKCRFISIQAGDEVLHYWDGSTVLSCLYLFDRIL